MADPLVFKGPADDADPDAVQEAMLVFAHALAPHIETYGVATTLDALISIWLDHMLKACGLEVTERALRNLRRDVPRMAAALRLANEPSQGQA